MLKENLSNLIALFTTLGLMRHLADLGYRGKAAVISMLGYIVVFLVAEFIVRYIEFRIEDNKRREKVRARRMKSSC